MKSHAKIEAWANRVVLERLARLERELTRLEAKPDADAIHDTRVAARRLRAALRHLEDYFRAGDAQRLRDEAAGVARLLGEIRDLDILAQNLAGEARRPKSVFQSLVTNLARRRERLLTRVAPAAAQLGRRLLWWHGRFTAIKPVEGTATVAEHFAKIYPKLVHRYFRRGRKLVRRQAGPEELHRYRIQTKRLRYVTEMYTSLDPLRLKAVLRELRGIQEVLGAMQDQSMMVAYFERRLMDVRTPLRQTEYMRVLHRARMRQGFYREAFFRRFGRVEKSERIWSAATCRRFGPLTKRKRQVAALQKHRKP